MRLPVRRLSTPLNEQRHQSSGAAIEPAALHLFEAISVPRRRGTPTQVLREGRAGGLRNVISRRSFLGQLSAASACALSNSMSAQPGRDVLASLFALADTPHTNPESWSVFGRIVLHRLTDSVLIQDGFVVHQEAHENCSFRFSARAPEDASEVQIWAGIRCRDRESRYVFALRGGNNDDLYLARYAPDGAARFLGLVPLGFHPVPGAWYTLRAVACGGRMHIYLNNEPLPRISVHDKAPQWRSGGVSLGGGWLPAEFRGVTVEPITADDAAGIESSGDRVWQPAPVDKARLRTDQRGAFRPIAVHSLDAPRAEFSLDGEWLFAPDGDVPAHPESETLDDASWHVIGVPDFWTPCLSWLHHESGFPDLDGLSATKGISDRLWESELNRLDGYTFDWRKTASAWYRQYIDLPADLSGRRFELCFDAIAKIAEVWVNGVKVGSHVGMFSEVRCDISSAVHPGRNAIAVHVQGRLESKASDRVAGVAVTVEVTDSMLNSLPHGMYPDEASGIWQPVRLLVTRQIWIDDVYLKPRRDGLDFDVTVRTHSGQPRSIAASYVIRSKDGKETLFEAPAAELQPVADSSVRFSTPKLAPRPWSPHDPALYTLEISLWSEGSLLDRYSLPVGFRTFTVQDGKLYLNGKPFWLRGANHFPHALRPNDAVLARRFMQLARAGNVAVTRSHTAPFTATWLQAADEAGMAVSFEGTWPWLMLDGEPPAPELLDCWSREFLSLIHRFRNHPSIILWTVNNEMKFEMFDKARPGRLEKKWEILSAMVKAIRAADPTRPIVCDSSYCRNEIGREYDDLVRRKGFDDGDIDDTHCYPGWYEPSFFHHYDGSICTRRSYPGRPLISQEMSTGYPRNDDGHPCRFYLFKHYTPQSLVGDEAWENRDPAIFLARQAFITKELAENFRRVSRDKCSGILHFAYLSWFKNVWAPESISPFPAYEGIKLALQPVLVSAELYGRHFYFGSRHTIRVCIANDAENMCDLPPTHLQWQIETGDEVLAQGSVSVAPVAYYSNHWIDLAIALPEAELPRRVAAQLTLRLFEGQKVFGRNSYDIDVASHAWAWYADWGRVAIFSPAGDNGALRRPGARSVGSLADLRPDDTVVLLDAGASLVSRGEADALRHHIEGGGNALLLNGGSQLASVFPEHVASFSEGEYEIAFMQVPESPFFDGLEPLDLAWWERGSRKIPQVCAGSHRLVNGAPKLSALASVFKTHGYLKESADFKRISGSPLFEIGAGDGHNGGGRIVVCELMLLETALFDPIAARLLNNLIAELAGKPCHCEASEH